MALSGPGVWWRTNKAGFLCRGTYNIVYTPRPHDVVPQISLIIPSTLAESTNEIVGSTMIDVKHGEPFPVYIRVDAFPDIPDSLQLTLDGPQDGALPTTLMTSALGAGVTIWSELFVGNSTTAPLGQQDYRYCLEGTQNCSSTISVSYSSPDDPIADVDEIGSEWEFTLSDQTVTSTFSPGCPPGDPGTSPTLLNQEGNVFTSTAPPPEISTYTGIVDGYSYSLAYRDPDNAGGTLINTHVTQYSAEPMLFGPGVWWWTNKAGLLCRGTYNIVYTPRPRIDSIAVADMSVSEDVGAVTVTVTLTHSPVQPVAARLDIEGTATDADYQVGRDINFGIGERQTTLNLVIVDDKLVEPNETIILKAVSQDLTLVGASSTTLTIEDNDVDNVDNHGDTIETATTLTLTLDTSVSGRIDPADDADYFRIDISTPIFVDIFTTGNLNTIGTLYIGTLNDGTVTFLQSDDDSGEEDNFLISTSLDPGIYYIEVSSFGTETGDYDLHVVDVVDNHGNTIETATTLTLTLDTSVSGTIDSADDADYFRIDISTPIFVDIFTTSDLDTVGRLLDNMGDLLQSDDDSGEENNFLINASLNSGTYFIEVRSSGTETGDYVLHVEAVDVDDLAPQISLIIPSTLTLVESTDGITMIYVRHGEPFPVYISVTNAVDSLQLTLDGPQDGALPTTLMTSALGAGVTIWSELFVGNSTTAPLGQQNYRYCFAGTQNCSSTISVSYSSPAVPVVDVDEISPAWDFTLSDQTATAGCDSNAEFTFPTLLSQEGNTFTSRSGLTFTGIVDGDSYSLAYRDPNFNVGPNVDTYIDIHATQYSPASMALSGPGVWWRTNKAGFLCRGTYNIVYTPRPHDVVPQISLIIPSTLAESTNEIVGSTMIDVKHGEPFPVYIRVDAFPDIPDSLQLTLDGPQDGALPTTLMTSALGAGVTIWSELFVGNSTTAPLGQQDYRYCLEGTQNCSSTISVSYSSPDDPIADVDEIGSEWEFTLSDQTVTSTFSPGCPPGDPGTSPTLLNQEGNVFTSTAPPPEISTYTGIVDGYSYSLAYRDPDNAGGTLINTHVTQYSAEPMLFGPGVWWWTNKAGLLCRGTYNIVYTPRPRIDSIAVADMSVSEDVGAVTVTVTLTHSPVQPVAARLDIEGTATDADYQVGRDINFGIGERQTTLNLDIVDDDLVEPNETIILKAVSQDLTLVGASSTTLTIEDNDVDNVDNHGDTIETATTLTLTLDTSVSGRIDPADDADYFRIDISTPIFVDIFTTGNLNTIGTLYIGTLNDGTVTFLQSDDDSGEEDNFLISTPLDPGIYFIEVSGSGTETGDYDLHIVDVVDNHGNTIETANHLNINIRHIRIRNDRLCG